MHHLNTFKMIAKGIEVEMRVGICDFEYLRPQRVVVNVVARGEVDLRPASVEQCLDYSKVCAFVHGWRGRPHVDLIETLLQELLEFLFADERVQFVDAEILKPDVISHVAHVGVGREISREAFLLRGGLPDQKPAAK